MTATFYAWDDAAKAAEPELTVEQCEQAIQAIRALEGTPGLGWTLHYLRGLLRTAGQPLKDQNTPLEVLRYHQGIYNGVEITMGALMVPFSQQEQGETDNEATQWYQRILEAKQAIAADEQGGQAE